MRRSQLYTIFLVVFIVMLGFGLLMPLLPYYVTEYGGNALLLGLLMSSYAAAQFVGAPLLGRLSDRMGRRPILIASLSGTTIGFVLLGLAAPVGRALATLLVSDPTAAQQNSAILGVMFFARILSGVILARIRPAACPGQPAPYAGIPQQIPSSWHIRSR